MLSLNLLPDLTRLIFIDSGEILLFKPCLNVAEEDCQLCNLYHIDNIHDWTAIISFRVMNIRQNLRELTFICLTSEKSHQITRMCLLMGRHTGNSPYAQHLVNDSNPLDYPNPDETTNLLSIRCS